MFKTKIVGILNLTPDSFSDGGKFDSLEQAMIHLKKMILNGADVIDIGAQSTRPNAIKISNEQEWIRLENILPAIIKEIQKFNRDNNKKIQISIDSYHFETIKKSYELGIDIINDVSGLKDEKIIEFIATKNITTILMHSLSVPVNPQLVINENINVNKEILNWACEKISLLQKMGVKKSQLIFDVGIGFGKSAKQSICILKDINSYRILGLPLYVGHSKKSFLDEVKIDEEFKLKNLDERAQKTLTVSKFLINQKIDYLRIHDVAEHVELI